MIDVWVGGIPVPQGSMRAFVRGGRAIITSANPHLRPWRATVTEELSNAIGVGAHPIADPVAVTLEFYFPRPASHFGKRGLHPSAPEFPGGRPDVDKLCRSVLDSLQESGALRDDSLVVTLVARKRYGERPGVRVYVEAA